MNRPSISQQLVDLKIDSQARYCAEQSRMVIAKSICPWCNNNVYDKYTLDECQTSLISECRHCGHDFYGGDNDA